MGLQELVQNPDFLGLPPSEQQKALERVSPEFAGLPPEEKRRFIVRVRGPGLLRSAAQGALIDGPRGFADLVTMPLRPLMGNALDVAGTPGDIAASLGESILGEDIPATTDNERRARSAGAGFTESLPFIGAGGLGAKLLQVLSGVLGETAAKEVEAQGGGLGPQFGASMVAGLTPGGLASAAAGGARRILPGAAGRAARGNSARTRAAEIVGDRVPDRREAAALLRDDVADAPFGTVANPAQTLEEAAPSVAALETTAIRETAGVSTELAKNIRRNRKTLQSKFEAINPETSPEVAVEVAREVRDELGGMVQRAYAGVGDVAGVDVSRLADVPGELARRFDPDVLPKATLRRLTSEFSETTNLRKLVNFEQSLTQKIRVATRAGRTQTAAALNEVKTRVGSILDEVAALGNGEEIRALQKAKNLRRVQGEVFENSRAMRAFMGDDNVVRGVMRVVNSPDKRDLDRLRAAVGDDPEAWAGVQQVLREHVFGDFEKFAKNPQRAMDQLRKRNVRNAYDYMFGEGAAEGARTFAKRLRQVQQGRARSAGDLANRAGSGVGKFTDAIFSLSTGDWRSFGVNVLRKLGVNSPTEEQARQLVGKALTDPLYMAGLLDELPAEMIPVWNRVVKSQFPNTTRSAAGVVGQNGE